VSTYENHEVSNKNQDPGEAKEYHNDPPAPLSILTQTLNETWLPPPRDASASKTSHFLSRHWLGFHFDHEDTMLHATHAAKIDRDDTIQVHGSSSIVATNVKMVAYMDDARQQLTLIHMPTATEKMRKKKQPHPIHPQRSIPVVHTVSLQLGEHRLPFQQRTLDRQYNQSYTIGVMVDACYFDSILSWSSKVSHL
jgi:hypothetical protein